MKVGDLVVTRIRNRWGIECMGIIEALRDDTADVRVWNMGGPGADVLVTLIPLYELSLNNPRHYHDAPTIREMLDKMEEKRTCDAPCLVAMLRVAVATLEELDDHDENRARKALESIERGLWETSPRELWFETPDSESEVGGGGLGQGENASPKEATDNGPDEQRGGCHE